MRQLLLLPILLCLLALPARAQAPDPKPPMPGAVDLPALLRRLAQNTPDSERLLEERLTTFTMTSVVEELDGKGRTKHTKKRVTRVQQVGGRRVATLLQAVDDGKDVTAKVRREIAERGADADRKKNENELSFPVPFTAESQPLHHFQLAGRDAKDPSKLRIRFSPAGRKGEDVMIGEALVDPEAGMLHWLKLRPSKFPSSLVDRLDIAMWFRVEPGVGAVMYRLVGQGEGGLLFVRKRRRSTVTFTDVVFKPAAESKR
jgi:hypothetical protein